jgi:hypothetical protein
VTSDISCSGSGGTGGTDRESPNPRFSAALDACPVDVIRKFINRSWRFMDAYRIPLSGKAAAWAVRKQKGHRTVSRTAMMHLDAVLNPN